MQDAYFTTFVCAREEEAVGIVCGAAMAGLKGIVLMQTSGFATLANVLASLARGGADPGADDGQRARHAGRFPARARRSSAAPCGRSCNRWASSTTR